MIVIPTAGRARRALVHQVRSAWYRAIDVYTSEDACSGALLLTVGLVAIAVSAALLPGHVIPSDDFVVLLYG